MNHRVVVWGRLRALVQSSLPRLSAGAALCLLALFAVGCGAGDGSESLGEVGENLTFPPVSFPATSATVDLTLPPLQTADRQNLTAGAKSSLSLNDRTTTTGALASGGPANGTNDLSIANLTATGNITLGARAHTGVLRSGGTVIVGTGSTTGTIFQNQTLPATSAIRFPVTIPAATQSVTAAVNEVATLAPGSYGALLVNSGARLTLTSGTFYFRSFDLEPTAQLIIPSGGVTIFVTGAVIYRGSISDGGNATRLRFFTFGTAQVRADAPFRGSLVASNGPVSVAAGSSAGFFYGTTLGDDPGTTFAPISEALSRIAPALAGTGVGFTATQGVSFNGLVANFTDGNQSDTASRFTATINWGDGTATSTGVVGGTAGSFIVSGTHTYASAGNFNVSVSLLNNVTGVTATIASTAQVVPGISATGVTFTATQGTPFNGLVANVADTNLADTAASFSASIAWGDGTTSAGVVAGAGGSFTVSGTHTYASIGNFTATVSVTRLPSTTVTATSMAHVVPGLAAAGVIFTAAPNVAFNGVVATLTDTNLADTGASFTASVAWGDGSTSPASVAGGSGTFTVVGTHTYAATGNYTVTVTITHVASSVTATATSTAKVTTALAATGVTLTAIQGVPFTADVATFTDTNVTDTPASFGVTVAWGDGTSSAGTVTGGAGSFGVSGTHTYAAAGTFTITVTILHNGTGEVATATSTAVVSSQLAASGLNFTAVSGVTATYTIATVTDANLSDTAASFTASIDWGDGTGSSAGSVVDGGTPGVFLVAGSHAYAGAGSHTVTISVTNTLSGATAGATATATVTATSFTLAGLDFTATSSSPFTGTIAVVSGADASESTSTLSALIAWGDGTTTTGFVVDAGSPGSFLVGGTHQYASTGTFTATITVTSTTSGGSASATALGTVTGELSATPFPLDATAGEAFTGLLASLTDMNTGDAAADFTVSVDWGDGTAPDAGFAVDGGSPGFFLVFGTHTYASSGSFTATATITKTSSSEVVTVTTVATVP